jgi:alpha-tubulin suppressor-like RCC1 family protein
VGFDDLTVKCWGEDFDALQTVFPEGIEQLVSGQMHMCVLDGAGDVWCAGNNGNRQCGQHGTSRVTDPRRVLGF